MRSFYQVGSLLCHTVQSSRQMGTNLHRHDRGVNDANVGGVVYFELSINNA